MPDATCPPPPLLTTKRKVRAGWSLLAAGALILGSVYSTAAPAAAAPGDASATGASIHLGLALGGETVIDETLVLSQATAPAGGGTDRDALIPIDIDEEQFGLRAQVLPAEATRDADGSRAEAQVTDVLLRLADQELVAARVLSAEVECPVGGPNTADARTAELRLGGQPIVDADLPTQTDVPLDVQLLPDGVVDASARVQLHQVEEADEDGARATALVANIRVIATLADNEVVDVEVGDVILADARCESANGADTDGTDTDADGTDADGVDADGTDADGTDADGTDADGTDDGIDGILPDDGDDDADGTDADGTDADGTDGFPGIGDDDDADRPSADSLTPDSGPTAGGTEVTVDGDQLDRTETVTVDGTEVEFEVSEDGTQLTFVTPPGDAGTVDVVLTYDDDSSDTLPFTYTDGTDADGTAVFGESEEGDGATDAGTTTGAAASGLPVTGAQQAPASAALALLLLTGGAWLLAWRERSIPTG